MMLLQLDKHASDFALWRERLKKLDKAESLFQSLRKALKPEDFEKESQRESQRPPAPAMMTFFEG
jgi:hypothetical protein